MNGVRLDGRHTIPLNHNYAYGSQTSIAHIHAWLEGLRLEGVIDNDHHHFDQNTASRAENIRPWASSPPQPAQRSRVNIEKQNETCQSPNLVEEWPQGSLPQEQFPDGQSTGSLTSSPSAGIYHPAQVPTTPVLVRKNPPAPRVSVNYGNRKRVSRGEDEVCFTAPPWRKRISCVPRPTNSHNQTPISGFRQRLENAYASRLAQTPPCSGMSRLNVGGEVRELSPHVTPYRKGKEPKRVRCPSYYDEDILPSPKVKVD